MSEFYASDDDFSVVCWEDDFPSMYYDPLEGRFRFVDPIPFSSSVPLPRLDELFLNGSNCEDEMPELVDRDERTC